MKTHAYPFLPEIQNTLSQKPQRRKEPQRNLRVEPKLRTIRVQSEKQRLQTWLEPERAAALLLGILGAAALGLAITGLYALLAQVVVQRTAEIAVRMAIGASRAAVVGMCLRQSALLMFWGAAGGLAMAAAVARLLASLSGQVNPLDGVTAIGVVALLAVVGASATVVPASRAASIYPVSALRAE